MRRAGILHCADIDRDYFKVLNARGQLPFVVRKDEQVSKWAEYTLDDAFRLRLQLDLSANESLEKFPEGLGAEYAPRLIKNATEITVSDAYLASQDIWIGVAVFEGEMPDGASEIYREHFCGNLAELLPHYQAKMRYELKNSPYKTLSATRVFMANATRAARFVVNRALELGLPEVEGLIK
ncbi:MAG: hypothetical protein D6773_12130 [Alphaproteobacteria bacterium]|nr:MAG: hypothetical protein D6773_12130 [Alphaproteobacteria bacterium]